MMARAVIAVLGTCDTKLDELLFLRTQLAASFNAPDEFDICLIDVGRSQVKHPLITIAQGEVLKHGSTTADLMAMQRGDVIQHMSSCCSNLLKLSLNSHSENPDTATIAGKPSRGTGGLPNIGGRLVAAVSAGGSGGTSLATIAMRQALPIGFPKVMLSTIASGDTSSLVGETSLHAKASPSEADSSKDITMMYSVVDIAGRNALLDKVLTNTAAATVGMARSYLSVTSFVPAPATLAATNRRRIGVSMFGVTTPCVNVARSYLEQSLQAEVYVFHATGHGGRAMERLVADNELDAVLDITTTEIADLLFGGNMSAGPDRLKAALRRGIPYVLSLGALDMVNFPGMAMVPEKYKQRRLHEHNASVTLMRTSAEECRQIGEHIAQVLRDYASQKDRVVVILPKGGVSMLSTPGAAFEDKDVDQQLFKTLEHGLEGSDIQVVEDDRDINDAGFARDAAQRLVDLF